MRYLQYGLLLVSEVVLRLQDQQPFAWDVAQPA
jgi:hypothetical protein